MKQFEAPNVKANKPVKDRVAKMLESNPLKPDDQIIKNIWYQDLVHIGCDPEIAKNIIGHLDFDQLTNPETIRRTRQKLQQEDPKRYGVNTVRRGKGEHIRQTINQ